MGYLNRLGGFRVGGDAVRSRGDASAMRVSCSQFSVPVRSTIGIPALPKVVCLHFSATKFKQESLAGVV